MAAFDAGTAVTPPEPPRQDEARMTAPTCGNGDASSAVDKEVKWPAPDQRESRRVTPKATPASPGDNDKPPVTSAEKKAQEQPSQETSGETASTGSSGDASSEADTEAQEIVPEQRELLWVDPKTILTSPYGSDINPVATPAEDEALEKSIAEDGVQNPLICKKTDKGELQCLAGTRRLRFALKTGQKTVPVFVVKFDSEEAERQFAIKDNIERRQLTMLGKAKLALLLWLSFRKSSTEKGKTKDAAAREKAATAASISAGTLFNFKFVLDYGDPETIEDMQSEKLTIGAAYAKTKAMIDGADKDTSVTRSARANQVLDSLKNKMVVLKDLPQLAEKLDSLSKAAAKCKAADKEKLRGHLKKARESLSVISSGKVVDKMLNSITKLEAELGK